MDNLSFSKKFTQRISGSLQIPLKDRIRVLLKVKNLSQNNLADECGLSKGTISKIVNGAWIPSSETMSKIAAVLECDSVHLFGDTKYWLKWREKMGYPEREKLKELQKKNIQENKSGKNGN